MNDRGAQRSRPARVAVLLAAVLALPVLAAAQTPSTSLLDLSIEELTELRVTSGLRRPEPMAEAATAVHVITADMIRRSPATSLPELLRGVPGLHVARLGSHRWAVSARGFNGQFSNKLLVLIDGRSVYSHVHSGVNWNLQDTLLEDIERIEVIRGSGASQWGANAVNGVINIITRSAHDTRGGYAALDTGNRMRGGAFRWGGAAGDRGSYRAYVKHTDRDELIAADGRGLDDDWWQAQLGVRGDWDVSAQDALLLEAALFEGEVSREFPVRTLEPPFVVPTLREDRTRGGHVLGRWTRNLDGRGQLSLQSYVDWSESNPLLVDEEAVTVDVDFQHRFDVGQRHELVWGVGYRRIRDAFDNVFTIGFEPPRRRTELYSGFVQDSIALTEALQLTVGTKLEHNDYSGWEVQPSLRIAWVPDAWQTFWAAALRAVRTPSRAESDVIINLTGPANGAPAVNRILGDDGVGAEVLTAFSVGYRVMPDPRLFADVTFFYNDYTDLVGQRPGPAFVEPDPTRTVTPLRFDNGLDGRSFGAELATRWTPRPDWRLDLAYTYFDYDLDAAPDLIPISVNAEGTSPRHQLALGTSLDLPRGLSLDGRLRAVGRLPGRDVSGYTTADLVLGWAPRPGLRVSVVGANLLQRQHAEFDADVKVQRSVLLRLRARF